MLGYQVGPEHVNPLQTMHGEEPGRCDSQGGSGPEAFLVFLFAPGAFSMLLLDNLTSVVIHQSGLRPSVSVNMAGQGTLLTISGVSTCRRGGFSEGQYQGAAKLGEELTIDCRLEKALPTTLDVRLGALLVPTGARLGRTWPTPPCRQSQA